MSKEQTAIIVRYIDPFPEVKPPRLNTEELKVAATEFAEKYTGLVVTRENYAEGKKSAAEQNSVITKLKAMKTELNKRAKAIVQPALDAIDEIIAIVEPPYKALKSGLDDIREASVREKVDGMMQVVEELCKSKFPKLSAAYDHLKAFVDGKCAEKRDGWLTKSWTLDLIRQEIETEVERMEKAMQFINDYMKGKPNDVARVAKTALVNSGFNELLALAASDKYEKTLGEQLRMNAVKAGKDPDAEKPDPTEKVKTSDLIPANEQMMEATVKFASTVSEMRKLVALIKKSGVPYEVIDQHIVINK